MAVARRTTTGSLRLARRADRSSGRQPKTGSIHEAAELRLVARVYSLQFGLDLCERLPRTKLADNRQVTRTGLDHLRSCVVALKNAGHPDFRFGILQRKVAAVGENADDGNVLAVEGQRSTE